VPKQQAVARKKFTTLDIVDRTEEPWFGLQTGDEVRAGPGGKFRGRGIDDDQRRPEMPRKGLLEFGLALAPIQIREISR
jgi:hypothetical protein